MWEYDWAHRQLEEQDLGTLNYYGRPIRVVKVPVSWTSTPTGIENARWTTYYEVFGKRFRSLDQAKQYALQNAPLPDYMEDKGDSGGGSAQPAAPEWIKEALDKWEKWREQQMEQAQQSRERALKAAQEYKQGLGLAYQELQQERSLIESATQEALKRSTQQAQISADYLRQETQRLMGTGKEAIESTYNKAASQIVGGINKAREQLARGYLSSLGALTMQGQRQVAQLRTLVRRGGLSAGAAEQVMTKGVMAMGETALKAYSQYAYGTAQLAQTLSQSLAELGSQAMSSYSSLISRLGSTYTGAVGAIATEWMGQTGQTLRTGMTTHAQLTQSAADVLVKGGSEYARLLQNAEVIYWQGVNSVPNPYQDLGRWMTGLSAYAQVAG